MVRRSLNWKFLLITVLMGGLALGGLVLLHAWQVRHTAIALVALADAQEKQSNWLKTVEYLDRYLRLRPDDANARVRLALTFTRGASSRMQELQAVDLHYRALATGSKEQEAEVRHGLAELLLKTGRLADAEKEARLLLDHAPEDPVANRILALALVGQLSDGSLAGTKTAAMRFVTTVEKARELNPGDERLANVLAILYREFPQVVREEYPKLTEAAREARADDSLNRLVHDNPRYAPAFLVRHEYRTRYGLAAGADEDLAQALRLAPDDPAVRLTAAVRTFERFRRERKRGAETAVVRDWLEQSKAHYEALVALPKPNRVPTAYWGLGSTWMELGDIERALAVWREGLKQFELPTIAAQFHARIAELCIDSDRLREAGEALDAVDQILAKLGGSVRRDERLAISRGHDLRRATWHVKRGEHALAIPLLRQVIASHPPGSESAQTTARAYFLLGSIYNALGEWHEAAGAFDQAAILNPDLHVARMSAATAWLQAGCPDLASERAEQALLTASTQPAWLSLAVAQLQAQMSRPPRDRSWGRLEQALQALDNSKEQAGAFAAWQIDLLRAEYLVARARSGSDPQAGIAGAIELLQRAEQRSGAEKAFWLQACFMYEMLKSRSDADRALAEFKAAGATLADMAVAQARLSMLRGDVANARALLVSASSEVATQDQDRLRAELVRAAVAAKDWSQAYSMLQLEHQQQPRNLALIRRLAEIDYERQNWKGIEGWEKKFLEAGVIGEPLARYYRALRLFYTSRAGSEAQVQAALREIEQVGLVRANWPEANTLQGIIELRLGYEDKAVAHLERAINLGERRVFVFEQLVAVLGKLNRWTEVERYLARLEADLPLSQRLAEMAVLHEVQRERPEQAIEIARKNAARHPTDATAQLWLGQLLTTFNHPDEAEQALKKALELAPGDVRSWAALLQFYSRTGKKTQMEATVANLDESTDVPATQRNLLLGHAHQVLGNLEGAERSFELATAEGQNDLAAQLRVAQFYLQTNPAKAEPHLNAALKIDPKSTPAKRMLAIVYAAQGNLEKAAPLLSETGSSGNVAAEDVRLHAILLVRQGGIANLQRAVRLLEEIVIGVPEPQVVDRQLLARLYEQQAQVTDDPQMIQRLVESAGKQLKLLAQGQEADLSHLAALARFLNRHQRLDEATTWVRALENRVESLSKPDAEVLALLIQVQLETKEAGRCERWLDKLAAIDPTPLRLLALQVHVAVQLDKQADVVAQIEPKAASLIQTAKSDEDKLRLYRGIGDLYASLKQHAAAEHWYRVLVAADARQYPVVVAALTQQGRVKEAIDLCEQASKTNETTEPAIMVSNALVQGSATPEDFQRAELILAAALERFPADLRLLYSVALVRVIQGNVPQSIELFRKIVEANPRFVPALNNLAMTLGEIPADRPEALRLIDQALEIAGRNASLLDTKAAILLYSGRSKEAVPLLESATRDVEADPRHHFHLALAYRDQGKTAEAKVHLQTALDRKLVSQVLTATDQKMLSDLRADLQP